MTSQGVFPARPAWRRPEPLDAEEPAPRFKYAYTDIPPLLWRERWLMLCVFLGLAVLGVGFALTLKTAYPAHSSVLVKLGQEYVYQPRAGDAGRGAVADNDQMIQSETEIMGSDALKMRVIRRIGVARFAPGQAAAYAAASPEKRDLMVAQMAQGLGRSLKIDTAPATPIIRLTYQASDPKLAADTLNTLLEEYLVFRRQVLLAPRSGALDAQRRTFEARLADEDVAYQSFLASNQIGDFEADKSALSQLSAQIEQQQFTNDASLKQKSGQLEALNGQLASLPAETSLYHDVDATAATKLADLRVQREALLSRYKNDAQPVKDLDAQIAQLEAGMQSGRTQTRGAERIGPNPLYQTMQDTRVRLVSDIAGLKQNQAALEEEMKQLTERRLRLAALEPQYQALSTDRDALASNVKDLTAKADESEAAEGVAQASSDNIRIIERATPPVEGKSLMKPVSVLAILFAGFTALCAGLLRMFLRPGLPTPATASRVLDLPVLGSAAFKQQTA